jgi:hypothetical protein
MSAEFSENYEQEILAEVRTQAETVRDALVVLPVIRPLRPERYWSGHIAIVEERELDQEPDVPVLANFKRREGSLNLTFHSASFEGVTEALTDGRPGTRRDLMALYIGHAMMSVLTIQALPPRKTTEFIEHISMPNGLFEELVISGLVNENSQYKTMNEFFIGNEDRIPKVSVARFATGAVYMAMNAQDPSFQERMTEIFRRDLDAELAVGDSYRATARGLNDISPDKSQEMFAEHIKWFNLGAAFPKRPVDIEDFVDVYRQLVY